jgi:hypothetical protein
MNNEHLNKFIDGVINSNDDDISASAHQFALEKVKSIVAEFKNDKVKKLHESFQIVLLEYNKKTGYDLQILPSKKLPPKDKPDMSISDVVVNGIIVGTIEHDINDFDGGLNFVSANNNYSEEFTDIEKLLAMVSRSYGVKNK